MPEINLSDDLHQQLDAVDDNDVESTLWRMLGEYKRAHLPGD